MMAQWFVVCFIRNFY